MPSALAAAAGHQGVERPHAERELAVDLVAAQRVRRLAGDGDPGEAGQRRTAVDRPAEAVEDPAEQGGTDRDLERRPVVATGVP